MKIALFVNKDIEANIAYNLLKELLLKHTVRIYYSDNVGKTANKPSSLETLEYFEKEFVFNELPIFTKKNKIIPDFEFFDNNFSSFPFKKCTDINSETFINEMEVFKPDLFISIRFGKIFKDKIIKVPKKGLINLHSAILPNYRGIMGTLHAIKQQNKTIGCTLHTIPNSGIDTGEIIEIATTKVNFKKSLFWNIIQLYPIGVNLIVKTVNTIENDKFPITKKQNLTDGNYFSVPTKSDFNEIENLGMKILTANDYETILKCFIFKDLPEDEVKKLKIFIANYFKKLPK